MRKRNLGNVMVAAVVGTLVLGLGACAPKNTGNVTETKAQESAKESAQTEAEPAPAADENKDTEGLPAAPYITKGVYANYSTEAENPPMDYFYIFHDEASGYTEDGNNGIGLPFSCEQSDGKISFTFGGEGEEADVFIVSSVENGAVTGYFEDVPERELVFVPMTDEDPDNFSAQNYVNAAKGEDFVYEDANGWRVKYNPEVIEVNGGGPMVTFVYTGESAGTNMITASYNVDKDAKTAIEDLAKDYGDKATTTEITFPGTEDVKGYYADSNSSGEGSGLYMSAMARDYMEGYLLFEFSEHKSGDDEMDMAVGDALAAIIDSLQFAPYPDETSLSSSLPAYEYPGPEAFYYEVYGYLVKELSKGYDVADVCIPCVQIISEDTVDDEIQVYGCFGIWNYDQNGDVLECVSGGAYPGLIHVKKLEDGGYEVTGMDVVEDGSNFTPSAKKIFGDHYDEFVKVEADADEREKVRAQIVSNYVAANDLNITAIKDYGWDPVTLPEENIDNFYSDL